MTENILTGGETKARVGYTDIWRGSKPQEDTPKSIDRNVQDDTLFRGYMNGPPCS